jgi:hypothetical protein
VPLPGEVVVLEVPGAICDLMSPGDPWELVAAPPAPLVPGVVEVPMPVLGVVGAFIPEAALPGDVPVLVVPGACCALMSPGEPCDLVASWDPGGTVPPVVPMLEPAAGAPVLSAVPVGDVAPPGGLPVLVVPGADCALMSPGEPCDFVASDEFVDWAKAPAAIRTQAENTAVFILFILRILLG